jgi:hypothetical protein
LLVLQRVLHLHGGRLVGSLALIESVEEIQEHILYGLVANRREVDNTIRARRVKLLIGKMAQQLSLPYPWGTMKLCRRGREKGTSCDRGLLLAV